MDLADRIAKAVFSCPHSDDFSSAMKAAIQAVLDRALLEMKQASLQPPPAVPIQPLRDDVDDHASAEGESPSTSTVRVSEPWDGLPPEPGVAGWHMLELKGRPGIAGSWYWEAGGWWQRDESPNSGIIPSIAASYFTYLGRLDLVPVERGRD